MSDSIKAEAKDMLRRDIVKYGAASAEGLRDHYPAYLGYTFADTEMAKWLRGMDKALRFDGTPDTPRLINRFCVGADPEFVLAQANFVAAGRDYVDNDGNIRQASDKPAVVYKAVHASTLGLKVGLAFGADLNGRLVELRVQPSRFVVEVLASILDTLRWMAVLTETTGYHWLAGGFKFGDGLGGHVHFGRKRPTTAAEAKALDVVWAHLMELGVFPAKEMARRAEGDAHGQRYGRPYAIDPAMAVRRQAHGYEYRSMPSWLDSPEQAYLSMVLAKLAVHDPGLLPLGARSTVVQMRQRILNLLRYYQGRDDDAAICLAMLARKGWPQHVDGAFQARWGIKGEGFSKKESSISAARKTVKFYPRMIPPSREAVQELIQYLSGATQELTWRLPVPTWSPTTLPQNSIWMMDELETHRQIGLGEIAADLVVDKRAPILLAAGGAEGMYFSHAVAKLLPSSWRQDMKKLLGEAMPPIGAREQDERGRFYVTIGQHLREKVGVARKILTCGVLPIWRVGDYKVDSFDKWQAEGKKEKAAKAKMLGKVLYEGGI